MFAAATAYAPGKLVDEGGQGSSNDNYGRTIDVPFEPELPRADLPYGVVPSNATPWLRALDIGALVSAGIAGLMGSRRIAMLLVGAAVLDVAARKLSPNFDSLMSMLPLNRGWAV